MALNQNDFTPAPYVPDRANYPLDMRINLAIGHTFLAPALAEAAASVNYPPNGLPNMADVVTPQMVGLAKARMITTPVQPGEDEPQYYRLGDINLSGGGV